MASKEKVLSISTAVKRRAIIIDGKKMALMNQEELRLDAGVRLRTVLEAFRSKERLTEESALALSVNLARAVRDVVPSMPSEIHEKLSDGQCIDIIVSFFKATGKPDPMTAQAARS